MGAPMEYRRLCKGLEDRGILVPITEDLSQKITDPNKDHYYSIYLYTDEHKKRFEETGSIAGITGLYTEKLVWDFDSADNIEQARQDTIELCDRLLKYGLKPQNLLICFSGSKGFAVEVESKNQRFNKEKFTNIVYSLANGLETYDTVVRNDSRIFRAPFTKHQKSGLYKTPLTLEELHSLTMEEIRALAATEAFEGVPPFESVIVPAKMTELVFAPPKQPVKLMQDIDDIDFTKKTKGWSNCKYSLLHGTFTEGRRNDAAMVIVATAKSLGMPKVTAYHMAKAAGKQSVLRYGGEEIDKDHLWNNVTEYVYSPNWKGATYSCRDGNTTWLTDICKSLGNNKCKHETHEHDTIQVKDVFNSFTKFAENIEELTLKTGIAPIDKKVHMTVGMSVGLIAPPGVGKTSISLAVLNNNSKIKTHSVFFSLDMHANLVFLKLCQKHTGLSQDKIFDVFKHDKKKAAEIKAKIASEYENVHFCFKAAMNADEIQDTILETQDRIGDKVKLAVVDYNELLLSEYSDSTASSAYVAQKMRQIANEQDLCVFSLFQPSKHSGGPSDEITSYHAAKGSSAIAQSVSIMLGASRPGYDPQRPEDDIFMTLNVLKNRLGPLSSINLHWDGPRGDIRELTFEETEMLKDMKARKTMEKEQNKEGGWL